MRILVTGGTGFVGRALIPRLRLDGHTIVAWVRSEARARQVLGGDVELVRAAGPEALAAAVARADAIVNLAGEPVVGRRWTAERRRVLEASGIGGTRGLVSPIPPA